MTSKLFISVFVGNMMVMGALAIAGGVNSKSFDWETLALLLLGFIFYSISIFILQLNAPDKEEGKPKDKYEELSTGKCTLPGQCAKGHKGYCFGSTECTWRINK